MRRVAHLSALLAIAATAVVAPAHAGAPTVIPQNQPTGQDKLSPPELEEKTLEYPQQGNPNPPLQWAALRQEGYISIAGDTVTRPIVWDDLGSGVPTVQGILNRWRIFLPGLYGYHCQCGLNERGEGRIYVVGPRPRLTPVQTSPNNNPPVTYTLDASGSNVVDWLPHEITEYAFDLNNDGQFNPLTGDQVGPEPTAPIAFDSAGEKVVNLRVTDDMLRSNAIPVLIVVPKPPAAPPEDTRANDTEDTADKTTTFEEAFKKVKIKVTTHKRMKLVTLRKRGLYVRVSGLRRGDRVRYRLTKRLPGNKLRSVGYRDLKVKATSIKLRVRLRRNAAKKILLKRPRAKLVRLGVSVEGSDGFNYSKAYNVRFR